MSDGTVSFETGKKVQKRAEEITRQQGIKGVTTINTTNAFADLAKTFAYKKLQEHPPQPKEMAMSHAAACLLCSTDFAKQCEVQVIKEFALVDTVKKHLKGKSLWCAHTIQALADVLIEREDGEQLIDKIIDLSEQVAKEKGHPGVITRDLFVALGRSVS
jgi:hypothetical protein